VPAARHASPRSWPDCGGRHPRSLFIAAEPRQDLGGGRDRRAGNEIHTGAWCDALADNRMRRRKRSGSASATARNIARASASSSCPHGLTCTAEAIAGVPEIVELTIGHFLIGEAVSCARRCRENHAHSDRPGGAHDPRCRVRSHRCARIERTIDRHGERFSPASSPRPSGRKPTAAPEGPRHYAQRFAAKEACAKALGTGLRAACFGATWAWSICPRDAHHEAHRSARSRGSMPSRRRVARRASM